MAWLQSVRGTFHVSFRFRGKKFKRSLKTTCETEARSRKARLEETIRLIESGRLEVPEGADIATFLLSDGKLTQGIGRTDPSPAPVTLEVGFTSFFDSIPDGSLEDETLRGMHRHERHFVRLLGASFVLQSLSLDTLQSYVNTRASETTHYGSKVTATTINKELITLGTVWRWADRVGKVSGPFPRGGLRLPKALELPAFQTWQEIERKIHQDGLEGEEAGRLWDALYLRRSEIDTLLKYVEQHHVHPHVYPMFVTAAHTGARRAELLRSRRSDFDLDSKTVIIREHKRARGRRSTRRVPLSPTLSQVMATWLNEDHPGGPYTFCHTGPINGNCTRMTPRDPISGTQAHDHFENTLKGSKWEKISG